jgi:PAS domain S-box-containing protein
MSEDSILIVEDNLLVAEDIRVKLGKLGFQVSGVAKNGERAIEKAKDTQPDLILMDIELGKGINGIEAAEQIRKKENIPVIFLTAYTDDETLSRAKKVEPYGYIVKPFDSGKLKTSIEVALYKKNADNLVLQSKEWFETTLQSIGDGVITTDISGRIIFMNPVAEKLTGWVVSESIGRPLENIFNIIDEDSRQRQESIVTRVLRENSAVCSTNHRILLSKDRRELNITDSGAPIRDASGNLIGVVIVFSDKTNERITQQALEKSESDFKLFFNSNPSATFVWERVSSDYQLIKVNDSVPPLDKVGKQKVTDLRASQLYKNIPDMLSKFDECLDSDTPITFEEYYENPLTGNYEWVNFTLVPIQHDRLILFTDNVTEQKEVAISLQKERERSKRYLDVAEVMLLALDLDGYVTLINPKGCRILGYQESEIIGKNWFDSFIHGKEYDEVIRVFKQFLSGDFEQFARYENHVVTKDGAIRIIEWHNSQLLNDSGEIIGIFSSGTDITEEKTIQQELEESEEKYRVLFKSSSDAIILVDTEELQIVDANDKAVSLYGYSYEELLTMRAPQLLAESAMTNAEDLIVPLRYHRKKDNSVFPVEITADYFHLSGRKINISTIRDISEIEEYQRCLNQARKVESIGNLAGGIAHDFNNILSSIIGFTELTLESAPKGSEMEDNLHEVFRAGKRAKELVQQILTFARKSEEKKTPVNIGEIAEETLKFIRSTLPTTIEIKKEITATAFILSSKSHIQQIFLNLCTNACHAMEPNGGELMIKVVEFSNLQENETLIKDLSPGEYIEISVADSGHGISDDKIHLIFDPYYTTKEVGEGTGIGLAVVHGIVESCDGKIIVESQINKGTTFRIFLPKGEQVRGGDESDILSTPRGVERILLVDDEPQIVKLGVRMLSQLGYSITGQTCSEAALELFKKSPNDFDLVIADVTMPKLSGGNLMTKILAIRPDLPIILSTGYSKTMTEKEAFNLGAAALLYKPYIRDELAQIIRSALKKGPK